MANLHHSVSATGITVQIGRSPRARTVLVSQAALKACSALKDQIYDGAVIINTDPIVFEIVLEYLEQSGLFEKLRITSRNPLEKLVGSSDMMLKFAKAWHLADALDLPQMQNKLIEIFSTCYSHFLQKGIRVPLCPEPFNYLRNLIGYYTKGEKFIIDFIAGLSQCSGGFSAEELRTLPVDVAQEVQLRRANLVTSGMFYDRIARGDPCFKVTKYDRNQQIRLHILSHVESPSRAVVQNSRSIHSWGRSISSRSSVVASQSSQSPTGAHRHRPRLSLPGIAVVTSPSRTVSQTLRPALQPLLEHVSQRTVRAQRSMSMPLLPTQAPFMNAALASDENLLTVRWEQSSSTDGGSEGGS